MRIREERKTEKKWRQQKAQERRRERNRKIVIQKRKYFICRGFEHIAQYCRNRRKIEENRRAEVGGPKHWLSNNKFEVLTSKVI